MVGAKWIYHVTLDTGIGKDTFHREAQVTESIIGASSYKSVMIYHVEVLNHPVDEFFDYQESRYFLQIGGVVYEAWTPQQAHDLIDGKITLQPMLVFPMATGDSWGNLLENQPAEPGWYSWLVEAVEPVETSTGTFEACYRLSQRTLPDHQFRWICPGVGMTRYEYGHHGSLHNEIWMLEDFRLP